MTYRITGLDPAPFTHLFGASEHDLAEQGARRMAVTTRPGFPCRVTLDDAAPGEFVLLVNHLSVGSGPYRASHAIFISEGVARPATFNDTMPPALNSRVLSLRAFDRDHMMVDAALVQPGEGDAAVRHLFRQSAAAYIHAHNATRGCFAAAIERTHD
jgi:hypothetical protein